MWNAFEGSKSRIPVLVGGREREGRRAGMGRDGTDDLASGHGMCQRVWHPSYWQMV